MHSGGSHQLVTVVSLVLIAAGLCAAVVMMSRPVKRSDSAPPPPPPAPRQSHRPRPDPAQQIAAGVDLLPGSDGRLPVRIRWVQHLEVPEAIAVQDGVVYVASLGLHAFRLSDGHQLWQQHGSGHEDEQVEASGGVRIGLTPVGHVRVFAPFEFDMVVRADTGALVSHTGADADPPSDFAPLPSTPTRHWRFDPLSGLVARRHGTVAWSIRDPHAMFDVLFPIDAGDGWVLVTGSGWLVALDRA